MSVSFTYVFIFRPAGGALVAGFVVVSVAVSVSVAVAADVWERKRKERVGVRIAYSYSKLIFAASTDDAIIFCCTASPRCFLSL